eukprot:4874126-Pyramimonas_sp.AAC.1
MHLWGVECILAVVGTGGPVKGSNITRASCVRSVRRENIPVHHASDWSVMRIYPCRWHEGDRRLFVARFQHMEIITQYQGVREKLKSFGDGGNLAVSRVERELLLKVTNRLACLRLLWCSHDGPIGRMLRGYMLTTDRLDACCAGIFSRRTDRTHAARVYSHDAPIGRMLRGYILTTDRSDGRGWQVVRDFLEQLNAPPTEAEAPEVEEVAEGWEQLKGEMQEDVQSVKEGIRQIRKSTPKPASEGETEEEIARSKCPPSPNPLPTPSLD